jgi:hypothetical protein
MKKNSSATSLTVPLRIEYGEIRRFCKRYCNLTNNESQPYTMPGGESLEKNPASRTVKNSLQLLKENLEN